MTPERKTPEYHLRSLELCFLREQLGGVAAVDSSLFERSVRALLEMDWDEAKILSSMKARLGQE